MAPASDQLREYLVPEEPVRAVYAATLSDDSAWEAASVGVTDRRLLCLSEDGAVVSVGYDSMCAIRSRSRSRLTYSGNDYRLLIGGGSFVAAAALLGTVALAATPLVPLLSLLAVGGLAATVHRQRTATTAERTTVDDVAEKLDAAFDGDDAVRRYRRHRSDRLGDQEVTPLTTGLVAVLAFAGLVAFAANPFIPFLVPPLAGGLALIDYAHRHRDELDGIEAVRRREREVEINTDDGRTVRLRSDPSEDIHRELSRVAFAESTDATQVVAPRS